MNLLSSKQKWLTNKTKNTIVDCAEHLFLIHKNALILIAKKWFVNHVKMKIIKLIVKINYVRFHVKKE